MSHEVSWFLLAFSHLGSSRPLGYGALGAIPISEMVVYWQSVGRIGPVDEFIDVIQALDTDYLSAVNGQNVRNKNRNNR